MYEVPIRSLIARWLRVSGHGTSAGEHAQRQNNLLTDMLDRVLIMTRHMQDRRTGKLNNPWGFVPAWLTADLQIRQFDRDVVVDYCTRC